MIKSHFLVLCLVTTIEAAPQSPLSLVAYRVNADPTSASYNKLERMGKGLVWNGVSSNSTHRSVFMPLTIQRLPGLLPADLDRQLRAR